MSSKFAPWLWELDLDLRLFKLHILHPNVKASKHEETHVKDWLWGENSSNMLGQLTCLGLDPS